MKNMEHASFSAFKEEKLKMELFVSKLCLCIYYFKNISHGAILFFKDKIWYNISFRVSQHTQWEN
jgi:hypothetical protein